MGFPEDPTQLRVGIGFGYGVGDDPVDDVTYANVTDDIEPRVIITRGRAGGSSITPPTLIRLQIKNWNGDLSPDNILSPYYGLLRVNTPLRVEANCGDGWVTRALGKIPDWSPRWSGPDIDRRVEIIAAGDDRRTGVSRDDVTSALTRQLRGANRWEDGFSVVSPNVLPVAWWRFEDSSDASEAASGLPGGQPMSQYGTLPEFGAAGPVGASSAVEFGGGGRLRATALSIPDTGAWSLTWCMSPQVIPDASTQRLFTLAGPIGLVVAATATTITATATVTATGASVALSVPKPSQACSMQCSIYQDGADINVDLNCRIDGFIFDFDIDLLSAATCRPPTSIIAGPTSAPPSDTSLLVCHPAIYDVAAPPIITVENGRPGEYAGLRWLRICFEEGLRYKEPRLTGQTMGPQLPGTTSALLGECVAVEEGFQSEDRGTGELELYSFLNVADPLLGYSTGSVTTSSTWLLDYNQAVPVLEPSRDDRDLFNRASVRVTSTGQAAIYEKTDGLRGSATSTGAGLYPDDSIARNVETLDTARNHASWLVNTVGTVDAPRFRIVVDLNASPELVSLSEFHQEWQQLDVGDILWVTGAPPEEVGPAVLDLVIDAITEVIDAVEWTLELWCSQRAPYNVFTVEAEAPTGHDVYDRMGLGNKSRVPAGVSTLDAAYDEDDTALSVTSEAVRWIDSTNFAAQFPFDISISGERIRVTAITGTGLTQTFTVVRGMDGVSKPLPDGSAVQLFRPPVVAL